MWEPRGGFISDKEHNEHVTINLMIVFFILKDWKIRKGTFDFLNPQFADLYHKNY